MGTKGRSRLIFTHILQSVSIAASGAVVVLLLRGLWTRQFDYLVDKFAGLGQYQIGLLMVFSLASLGIAFPRGFRSIVISLKLFPNHIGLLLELLLGVGVYLFISNLVLGHTADTYAVCLLLAF